MFLDYPDPHLLMDQSRFDGDRREDFINHFVGEFEAATDRLMNQYRKDDSAAIDVMEVLRAGAQINRFMQKQSLTARAQNDWRSQRGNLEELARAYSVSMSWKDYGV